ncbi:MAG: type II methionyl aminopeptidase [Conexivisphaerales archaeon]
MSGLEAYQRAGSIAASVLKFAQEITKEGIKVIDLCEELEEKIKKLGGLPAFPCNVSQNDEAAHYTAGISDTKIILPGSTVKIDIGVHINGYIADTALTIALSQDEMLMAKVNEQLLYEAIKSVKAGGRIGAVGDTVESEALRQGFRPISNLSGHQLDRYTIHAGVSVPNVRENIPQNFKQSCAYAIEPFLVSRQASGWVVNHGGGNIFRLTTRKRTKDANIDQLTDYIWSNFKTLPFTPRWLVKDFKEEFVKKAIKELESKRIIMEYPILVESSGAKVTQFEHTIYVGENRTIITTLAV